MLFDNEVTTLDILVNRYVFEEEDRIMSESIAEAEAIERAHQEMINELQRNMAKYLPNLLQVLDIKYEVDEEDGPYAIVKYLTCDILVAPRKNGFYITSDWYVFPLHIRDTDNPEDLEKNLALAIGEVRSKLKPFTVEIRCEISILALSNTMALGIAARKEIEGVINKGVI